ncbi:hypothetical protein D3C83_79530 [compost metagenome]
MKTLGAKAEQHFFANFGRPFDQQFANRRFGYARCDNFAIQPIHRAEKLGDIGAVRFVINFHRRADL